MPEQMNAELRLEITRLQDQLSETLAEKQKDADRAERASNRLNLLEAMLEIIPVGVVLADEKGQIVLGNSNVEKMLRHQVMNSENPAAYGDWISFHADGRRVESHEYPLAKVVSENHDYAEIDVNYQRGDASKFWLRIIGQPVIGNQGERIGAVVALIDVDREHQLAEQQKILIGELNHRVKNAFSVVKSIVSMSMRKEGLPKSVRETIEARLDAYAKAHAKLVGSQWEQADLGQIIQDVAGNIGAERIIFDGPAVNLPSREALALSMALYELSTNAVKYGALSNSNGRIVVSWTLTPQDGQVRLAINWTEYDGPKVAMPSEPGFGSFIIDTALTMETGGEVTMAYNPAGYTWDFVLQLDRA
ncbi:HWE histidine kinase domain-containing protein [Yoonia sp. MH D7]